MATIAGVINGCISSSTSSSSSFGKLKKFQKKTTISGGAGKRFRVSCDFTNSIASDPYKTLRIHPGASESEVKKAFRQLALKEAIVESSFNKSQNQMHHVIVPGETTLAGHRRRHTHGAVFRFGEVIVSNNKSLCQTAG